MTTSTEALVPRMREICGARNVITDPLELRTYECDGLTSHRSVPALAVLGTVWKPSLPCQTHTIGESATFRRAERTRRVDGASPF